MSESETLSNFYVNFLKIYVIQLSVMQIENWQSSVAESGVEIAEQELFSNTDYFTDSCESFHLMFIFMSNDSLC